jgi:hypothetical protein
MDCSGSRVVHLIDSRMVEGGGCCSYVVPYVEVEGLLEVTRV